MIGYFKKESTDELLYMFFDYSRIIYFWLYHFTEGYFIGRFYKQQSLM